MLASSLRTPRLCGESFQEGQKTRPRPIILAEIRDFPKTVGCVGSEEGDHWSRLYSLRFGLSSVFIGVHLWLLCPSVSLGGSAVNPLEEDRGLEEETPRPRNAAPGTPPPEVRGRRSGLNAFPVRMPSAVRGPNEPVFPHY